MSLPIEILKQDILSVLAIEQNLVIQAPPGAGKTTAIPLMLLEAGLLETGQIILLEPRRLAAKSVAERMASLLGEKPGETVGYRIRMDSRVGPDTKIVVVTEGVLTRMMQDDPELSGVVYVIFDEFHERSIHADLALALALDIQDNLRDDLHLIAMSATFDGEAVADLLGGASILTSEGRNFPLEIRYSDFAFNQTSEFIMADAIADLMAHEKGSLLAFLPGGGEIAKLSSLLASKRLPDDISVHQLYGAMSITAQRQAIEPAPSGKRKIVLATNIAETSLTIQGIRMVVDAGQRRSLRFDPNSGMGQLEKHKISKASADQRAGRAGRTEAGVALRLWRQEETRSMQLYDTPEIMESDLAPMVLELARWGISDPKNLKWMDLPPTGNFAQAQELLFSLGLLDDLGRITDFGRQAADMPVHPRFAAMILKSKTHGLGWTSVKVAALLSERDFWGNRSDCDLSRRIRAMVLPDNASAKINKGQWHKVRQLAERIAKDNGIKPKKNQFFDPFDVGLCVAFAYPDRIAGKRKNQSIYHMTGGKGAVLNDEDEISNFDYIAVADLDGAGRNVRIHLAAPLSKEDLEAHFSDQFELAEETQLSPDSGQFIVEEVVRLGALVLSRKKIKKPSDGMVQKAILEHIRKKGLRILPWERLSEQWRDRLQRVQDLLGRDDFPKADDESLLRSLEDWLAPHLHSVRNLDDLAKINLAQCFEAMIPWDKRTELDTLLPSHLRVPTNRKIPIDYSQETGPILAVRIQEVFGLKESPMIAQNSIKVTMHLLSPAKRPLAITQDLESFWNNAYKQVKAENKGRYIKHYWPDNPLEAQPTNRVKSKME